MKQPLTLEPALKKFHWAELANIHLDLNYCRHRFIQSVNETLATDRTASISSLDQLAQVDELLEAAGDALERAKAILFDACYDGPAEAD